MLSPILDTLFGVMSVLFALISPLVVFIVCDHNRSKTLADIPRGSVKLNADELHPVEIATLHNDGDFRIEFLWPELVRLGVNNVLKIERIGKKFVWTYGGWFKPITFKTISMFSIKTPITQAQFDKLDFLDKKIIDTLFAYWREIDLFAGRDYLAGRLPEIGAAVRENLVRRGLLSLELMVLRQWFLVIGAVMLAVGLLFMNLDLAWRVSAAISGVIAILFGILTPKISPDGMRLVSQIKKMEKEFDLIEKGKKTMAARTACYEKAMPVALVLEQGNTLTRRVASVYGSNFLTNYKPNWYKDFETTRFFDGNNLVQQLNETFMFSSYRPAISLQTEA